MHEEVREWGWKVAFEGEDDKVCFFSVDGKFIGSRPFGDIGDLGLHCHESCLYVVGLYEAVSVVSVEIC